MNWFDIIVLIFLANRLDKRAFRRPCQAVDCADSARSRICFFGNGCRNYTQFRRNSMALGSKYSLAAQHNLVFDFIRADSRHFRSFGAFADESYQSDSDRYFKQTCRSGFRSINLAFMPQFCAEYADCFRFGIKINKSRNQGKFHYIHSRKKRTAIDLSVFTGVFLDYKICRTTTK